MQLLAYCHFQQQLECYTENHTAVEIIIEKKLGAMKTLTFYLKF